MTTLQQELRRLYQPADGADDLADAHGRVRCLVLELTSPPDWAELSPVWQGVQRDLDLSAPAIAVSGTDGLQLWFSLAEPVAAARGHVFLEGLRVRFLPGVKPGRVRLLPAPGASAAHPELHARPVPALQRGEEGNWSAFVAPDLAPVFADTPWLDIPPSEEGQAELLRRLQPVSPAAFEAAWQQLGGQGVRASGRPEAEAPQAPHAGAATAASGAAGEAQAFLLQVMRDEGVALALRIEAARALLPSGR